VCRGPGTRRWLSPRRRRKDPGTPPTWRAARRSRRRLAGHTGALGGQPATAAAAGRDRGAGPRRGGRPRGRPECVNADKAYSHRSTRITLRDKRIRVVIPQKSDQVTHRKAKGSAGGRPPTFDANTYRDRNVVERAFNRLKSWRGIATPLRQTRPQLPRRTRRGQHRPVLAPMIRRTRPRRGGSAAECPRALPVDAIGDSYADRRPIEVTSEYQSGWTFVTPHWECQERRLHVSGVDVTTFPGFGALRSLPRSGQGPQGAPLVESVGAAPATGRPTLRRGSVSVPEVCRSASARIWTAAGPPAHAGHRVRAVAPRLLVHLLGGGAHTCGARRWDCQE
jgi:transposase